MKTRSSHRDIPFPLKKKLEDALKPHGFSRNEHQVTCHVSDTTFSFPRPYLAFIKLLLQTNHEITDTWESERKQDRSYWFSFRGYLNALLLNTLVHLQEKKRPMALECWLHREFMLCRHDSGGRREYLELMNKNGMVPYAVHIFQLDWVQWWSTQKKSGYYDFNNFQGFEKLLNEDLPMIKKWGNLQQFFSNAEVEDDSPFSSPSSPGLLKNNLTLPSGKAQLQSVTPAGPHAKTELGGHTTFVFACLPHEAPDLPFLEQNGGLHWPAILECLGSIYTALEPKLPEVAQFLQEFDQVRRLNLDTVAGFDELLDFLDSECMEICKAIQRHHADVIRYLMEEMSLEENEAEDDIVMITSWLQQFMVRASKDR